MNLSLACSKMNSWHPQMCFPPSSLFQKTATPSFLLLRSEILALSLKPFFFLLYHGPHSQILSVLPSKCIYIPTTSHYLQQPLIQTIPDQDHRCSFLTNLLLPPFSLLQLVLYVAARENRFCHSSAQTSPCFLFSQ